jgi:hypothetical protein
MDWNAFVGGVNLAMAVWCGTDWLRDQEWSDAVLFWLNAVFFVLNIMVAVCL